MVVDCKSLTNSGYTSGYAWYQDGASDRFVESGNNHNDGHIDQLMLDSSTTNTVSLGLLMRMWGRTNEPQSMSLNPYYRVLSGAVVSWFFDRPDPPLRRRDSSQVPAQLTCASIVFHGEKAAIIFPLFAKSTTIHVMIPHSTLTSLSP